LKKGPTRKKINLELPPDLEAVYANFALISHSPSEFVIDFACVLPNPPKAKVRSRIISTPRHAKLLLRALRENVEKYEAKFGEIQVSDSGDALAQQFFGSVSPPSQES